MPKYFSFPAQKESDECPEIHESVRVWGDHQAEGTKNDGGAALAVLAKALKDDPKLKKKHPEFLKPDEKKKSRSSPLK